MLTKFNRSLMVASLLLSSVAFAEQTSTEVITPEKNVEKIKPETKVEKVKPVVNLSNYKSMSDGEIFNGTSNNEAAAYAYVKGLGDALEYRRVTASGTLLGLGAVFYFLLPDNAKFISYSYLIAGGTVLVLPAQAESIRNKILDGKMQATSGLNALAMTDQSNRYIASTLFVGDGLYTIFSLTSNSETSGLGWGLGGLLVATGALTFFDKSLTERFNDIVSTSNIAKIELVPTLNRTMLSTLEASNTYGVAVKLDF